MSSTPACRPSPRRARALRATLLAPLLGCALAIVATAHARDDANDANDATTRRILELEALGRAQPLAAADELGRLVATTGAHSPQRLEALTVQGLTLTTVPQTDAADAPAAQLEAWASESGAPLARTAAAATQLVRARMISRAGALPRAEAMLQDAIALLPAELEPRQRYRYIAAQTQVKQDSGKLDVAVQLGHQALSLADATGVAWRQSEARSTLAYAYCDAKQCERARGIAMESIALAEQAADWVALSRAHNTMGIVLDGLGDVQGERRSFALAIDYARRAGSKLDEVRRLANMADFYLKSGDYDTALTYAERALPIARELNDASSETVALANVGLSEISLGRIDIGKRHVREALAIDERRGSPSGVSDMMRELGVYLEKAGDLSGAIEAYHAHRRLANTLLRADHQKAILAVQEQYDAERRERALALLNRENDLKAEQLHQRDLEHQLGWLVAAAVLLSLAVIGLLHRRVREMNRRLASSNELLQVQSERDPLTGLANRRHFQAAMRRLAADGKLAGTLYLIDIDHFKSVNDRHGHSAGDAVLAEVARRLRETLREHDLIVRWGGEEFLVVVQSLDAAQVDALAQRMLGALDRAAVVVDTRRIAVTASIGYATFPIGPDAVHVSWERAINLVDTAMYLAKAHGRNRAYGVRLLKAHDEAEVETLTHTLEDAWRDGRVDLTLLQGRTPLAVAA